MSAPPGESSSPIPSAHRLLVLIPELHFTDNPQLAQHLRELAGEAGANITLLSLVEQEDEGLHMQHRLETFASIIRNSRTAVNVIIEIGSNWHHAVQEAWQVGDLIVCPIEHTIKTGIFHRTRILAQVIVEDLHKTVYAIST